MKPLFHQSLRARLLLLVFVAVIPAWGVIAYTASEQRQMATAEIQRNVLRLAEFSAREEDQVLLGTRQILIALAKFIQTMDQDPIWCSTLCADLLGQFKRYANIGAVNSGGDVFCSAVPLSRSMNAADQSWFRHAVQSGDFEVGDYHVGRITDKPVLVLSYPYRQSRDKPASVVFAALDLEWLNRYIFEIGTYLPDGFTITQMDENGIILAREPKAEQLIGRSMADHSLFREILSREKGMIEASGERDVPYIYAFAPLRSSIRIRPVYMILGISRSLAFADSNRILRRNLTLLGIVALAAMLAAWFGSDLFIMRQVKGMAQASRRLASGDMSARTGLHYGSCELGHLAKTFDEMAAALEQRQSERRQAEMELKRSQELFRSLSEHLQEIREEERTRIARKIHDDMGQALTALKIDLSWLNKRLAEDQDAIREKLQSMNSLIDETIETVHNVSEDLRPGILDDFGLAAAIEWQAEEFQKRTGIECTAGFPPEEFDLSKEKSTNLFRIVQESLTNVIRHAAATKVEINLAVKDSILLLVVQDNGKGIPAEAVTDPTAFGLIGIEERVHSMDGEVDIIGIRNNGTRIIVRISLS